MENAVITDISGSCFVVEEFVGIVDGQVFPNDICSSHVKHIGGGVIQQDILEDAWVGVVEPERVSIVDKLTVPEDQASVERIQRIVTVEHAHILKLHIT